MIQLKRLEKRRESHLALLQTLNKYPIPFIESYYNLISYFNEEYWAYQYGLTKKALTNPHPPASYNKLCHIFLSHYSLWKVQQLIEKILSKDIVENKDIPCEQLDALSFLQRITQYPSDFQFLFSNIRDDLKREMENKERMLQNSGPVYTDFNISWKLLTNQSNWSRIGYYFNLQNNTLTIRLWSNYISSERYYSKIIVRLEKHNITIEQIPGNMQQLIEELGLLRAKHPLLHKLLVSNTWQSSMSKYLINAMTAFGIAQCNLQTVETKAVHLANQRAYPKNAQGLFQSQLHPTNIVPLIIPEPHTIVSSSKNKEVDSIEYLTEDKLNKMTIKELPVELAGDASGKELYNLKYSEFLEWVIEWFYSDISTNKAGSPISTHYRNTLDALIFQHILFLKTYRKQSITHQQKTDIIIRHRLKHKLVGLEKEKAIIIAKELGVQVADTPRREFHLYPAARTLLEWKLKHLFDLQGGKIVLPQSLTECQNLIDFLYDQRDDLVYINKDLILTTLENCIQIIKTSTFNTIDPNVLAKLGNLYNTFWTKKIHQVWSAEYREALSSPVVPSAQYSKLLTQVFFENIKKKSKQSIAPLILEGNYTPPPQELLSFIDELFAQNKLISTIKNIEKYADIEDYYDIFISRIKKKYPWLCNESEVAKWTFHFKKDHNTWIAQIHPTKLYELLYALGIVHYSVKIHINPGIQATQKQNKLGEKIQKECWGLTAKCADIVRSYSTSTHHYSNQKLLGKVATKHDGLFLPMEAIKTSQ